VIALTLVMYCPALNAQLVSDDYSRLGEIDWQRAAESLKKIFGFGRNEYRFRGGVATREYQVNVCPASPSAPQKTSASGHLRGMPRLGNLELFSLGGDGHCETGAR